MASNTDFIRNLYAAFGRSDVKTILDNLDPTIVWKSNCDETIPWGGTRHGVTGAASFFQELGENLDFESFESREFFEAGDTVIVVGYTRARLQRNGRPVNSDWVHVFTLRNGKVSQFREFYDTAAVIRALAA